MTREDAINRLHGIIKSAYCNTDDLDDEAIHMAIHSLEKDNETGRWISAEVLDKIKAEIERKAHSGQWSDATMYGMLKAVTIIDKYKAESEVEG